MSFFSDKHARITSMHVCALLALDFLLLLLKLGWFFQELQPNYFFNVFFFFPNLSPGFSPIFFFPGPFSQKIERKKGPGPVVLFWGLVLLSFFVYWCSLISTFEISYFCWNLRDGPKRTSQYFFWSKIVECTKRFFDQYRTIPIKYVWINFASKWEKFYLL